MTDHMIRSWLPVRPQRWWLSQLCLAVLVSIIVFQSHAAQAAFKVCNQSVTLYNVAIGAEIGGKFATEGWWLLPANSCVTPIKEDLDELRLRYVYVYASNAAGDSAFEGEWDMCVDTKRFRVERVQGQPWDCWVRGLVEAKFKEIDTGNTGSWTVFIQNSSP